MVSCDSIVIAVNVDVANILLRSDKAVAIGMVVNELPINSGAGGYGPLAGKKKRALAVDPGLPIRPPNVGGTGRAVASSLLRSGGAVERGAGAPRPRRFQRNYTASLNLNLP